MKTIKNRILYLAIIIGLSALLVCIFSGCKNRQQEIDQLQQTITKLEKLAEIKIKNAYIFGYMEGRTDEANNLLIGLQTGKIKEVDIKQEAYCAWAKNEKLLPLKMSN
jgi:hypothetical protein